MKKVTITTDFDLDTAIQDLGRFSKEIRNQIYIHSAVSFEARYIDTNTLELTTLQNASHAKVSYGLRNASEVLKTSFKAQYDINVVAEKFDNGMRV